MSHGKDKRENLFLVLTEDCHLNFLLALKL